MNEAPHPLRGVQEAHHFRQFIRNADAVAVDQYHIFVINDWARLLTDSTNL
jgi:hypothetical protein